MPSMAQLPETEIYLLDMQKNGAGKYSFSNPRLISNPKGYNNQPYFMDDDKTILFASNNGSGNTNIYKYDMNRKKIKRFTKTQEAEYSPQQSKAEEGEITCVRVEKDTVSQIFYSYYKKGKKGHFNLPNVNSIGYYTWLNGAEIIALTLPEPFTLTKYNVITLKADTLVTNIGRTFQVQNNKLLYVDKIDSNHFYIKQMVKENIRPRKNKNLQADDVVLCETLEGQEDFCMGYDGTIFMGKEGKLYAWYTKKIRGMEANKWHEIADFTSNGIPAFYRLVINQDMSKIALVAYKGKKP
jgi:hypothetical protein